MATAPTLPLVPVEVYLKTDYETPTEYLNGLLVEKRVGSRTHSRLQVLLSAYLLAREQRHGFRVYSEQHIQTSPERYRVPDLLAMPADHRRDEILTEPPLFTVEIISPGEQWTEITGKYRDHLSMGVPLICIVDPYQRTLFAVGQDGLLRQIGTPRILEAQLPGGMLTIDFEELFNQLN